MNELSGSCWVFTALSPSAGSSAYATADRALAQPGTGTPARPGASESAAANASINAHRRASLETAATPVDRKDPTHLGFNPDVGPSFVSAAAHARILTASPPTSSG